jgi:hypothetical protein
MAKNLHFNFERPLLLAEEVKKVIFLDYIGNFSEAIKLICINIFFLFIFSANTKREGETEGAPAPAPLREYSTFVSQCLSGRVELETLTIHILFYLRLNVVEAGSCRIRSERPNYLYIYLC